MKKKVTIKDIAKHVGVNPSTVSKALRESSDISVEMQKKVKRISKEMGYRPNRLAKSLIDKRSNILGVLIPDLRISFFSEATRGIYEEAAQQGFECILMVHDEKPENERKKLEFLSDINVDGILLNAVDETTNLDFYQQLKREGIKIVCWDRKLATAGFDSVTINDECASFDLTNKFIQSGRKKIMFIGPNKGISVAKERFEGYLRALTENNVNIDHNLILETELTFESAHNLLYEALQKGTEIDAIICVGGLVAFGAGNAILERKLRIPEDVILGEFGDNRIISTLGIPFYSVNQNPYKIGKEAVDLLIKTINDKNKHSESQNIIIEHEIICRNLGVQKKRKRISKLSENVN